MYKLSYFTAGNYTSNVPLEKLRVTQLVSGFGGLVVSMLASGTKDRIFRAKKSTACLPLEGR
jgi:hypothetical protein